ncbi:MAG TPA: hypothetical protein VK616_07615 [Flavitalea sp.]|nr:hypothetical protein [Flavitalea sp.]HTF30845.1 hypothetical protein [Flavitalea sp.]
MNLIPLAYLVIIAIYPGAPELSTSAKDSSAFFAGTTPCNNIIRPLNKIAPEADCAWNECHCFMVEWKLTLYSDPLTRKPTSYKLISINRFTVRETNMYSQPGTKTESEGKWAIIHGSKTNPEAIVYQLNPDKPEISLSFLKLSDNLLHIVDQDGRLMIGNEFWSYSLNRAPN